MKAVLVDTNVAVVANGRDTHAGPECVIKCVVRLENVVKKEMLLLDDGGHILGEYLTHLSPSGQPGAGDAFMKWVWLNQASPKHCKRIRVHYNQETNDYLEFPKDEALEMFDRSDRKFVAVGLGSKLNPPILNAVDTDWRDFQRALKSHGVEIEFICPEMMGQASRSGTRSTRLPR